MKDPVNSCMSAVITFVFTQRVTESVFSLFSLCLTAQARGCQDLQIKDTNLDSSTFYLCTLSQVPAHYFYTNHVKIALSYMKSHS